MVDKNPLSYARFFYLNKITSVSYLLINLCRPYRMYLKKMYFFKKKQIFRKFRLTNNFNLKYN